MAASRGHVDIVKYFVENGAEVNAVATVWIDMFNITYRLRVVILLYSFQDSVSNCKKTDDSIFVLCLCLFLQGCFNSHVIKRVTLSCRTRCKSGCQENVTIIMYMGTQCRTQHLIALSSYFKVSNIVFRKME